MWRMTVIFLVNETIVFHNATSVVAAYEHRDELFFKLPEEESSIVSIPHSSGTCNILTTLAVTILWYDKGLRHDRANDTSWWPTSASGSMFGAASVRTALKFRYIYYIL